MYYINIYIYIYILYMCMYVTYIYICVSFLLGYHLLGYENANVTNDVDLADSFPTQQTNMGFGLQLTIYSGFRLGTDSLTGPWRVLGAPWELTWVRWRPWGVLGQIEGVSVDRSLCYQPLCHVYHVCFTHVLVIFPRPLTLKVPEGQGPPNRYCKQ